MRNRSPEPLQFVRSPCTIKGAGTEHEEEMQIASPEEVAAPAAAVGPRWEAIVFTAAYGGMRWGELAGLRRRDINLVTNAISVTRKLGEVNGRLSFSAPRAQPGGARSASRPSSLGRWRCTSTSTPSLAATASCFRVPKAR